jgi:hypothetical protein
MIDYGAFNHMPAERADFDYIMPIKHPLHIGGVSVHVRWVITKSGR